MPVIPFVYRVPKFCGRFEVHMTVKITYCLIGYAAG